MDLLARNGWMGVALALSTALYLSSCKGDASDGSEPDGQGVMEDSGGEVVSTDGTDTGMDAGGDTDPNEGSDTGLDAGGDQGDSGTAVIWVPAPGTTWQWQITGTVNSTLDVKMYDIDLFDAVPSETVMTSGATAPTGDNAGIISTLHGQGRIVICYMDSGAYENYRPDQNLFPSEVLGNSSGWPGEKWLDIREQSWSKFAWIIWARMDLAKTIGCDGVEPDQNNPLGNDPGFNITAADQKKWYLEVARQAHLRGLSVGQKNGVETTDKETASAFDWNLNEECFQYNECDTLQPFLDAGKVVFSTEYQGDPTSFCPQANTLGFSSIRKRLDLDAWVRQCWRAADGYPILP